MSPEEFHAWGELNEPLWKFWRWGKRKQAEFVIDDALSAARRKLEQQPDPLPNRANELIEELYGIAIGGS